MSASASKFVLAFDVGGSHASAGLCRLSNLELVRVTSSPLAPGLAFDAFADLLHKLGEEAAAGESSIAGASLAVPGPFDVDAGVSLMRHKLTSLYGKDLRAALALRFGWARDRFQFLNDASAFLLGEVAAGSARGAARAVGLTLGTGIGSAFAVNGVCVTEGEGVPPGGEIWNWPYNGGTVEDLISTRAIKADYKARTGVDMDVAEIAASAAGNPIALEVFAAFGIRLGNVLRDVIAPFRPEKVVLGGGISRSAFLFLPVAEEQVEGLGFHLVKSGLVDRAALVGAAESWRAQSEAQATSAAPVVSAKI